MLFSISEFQIKVITPRENRTVILTLDTANKSLEQIETDFFFEYAPKLGASLNIYDFNGFYYKPEKKTRHKLSNGDNVSRIQAPHVFDERDRKKGPVMFVVYA